MGEFYFLLQAESWYFDMIMFVFLVLFPIPIGTPLRSILEEVTVLTGKPRPPRVQALQMALRCLPIIFQNRAVM